MVRQFFRLLSACLLLFVVGSAFAQQLLPVPRTTTDLLSNASFDIDSDGDKLPDGWSGKNTTALKADKLKCDKPDKLVAHSGTCAFMFRGNPAGGKSKLQQTIADTSTLISGVNVTFSVYLNASSGVPGTTIGKAKLTYSDGTSVKLSLAIPNALERGEYQLISNTHMINMPEGLSVSQAKVHFRYKSETGKFLIDDASFAVITADPTATPTDPATPTITPSEVIVTLTVTNTDVPPTLTNTDVPPTLTNTDVPPTPTNTPTATATNTDVPPTLTSTDVPPTPTNTPTATATNTDIPPTSTETDIPPTTTNTEVLPTLTNTDVPPTPTNTPTATATNIPPTPTTTPSYTPTIYMTATNTPFTPTNTQSPPTTVPTEAPTSVALVDPFQLIASDGSGGDVFGLSVAIDNNTVVIGAPLDSVGSNFQQGSVYVFVRSGSVWTQQQKLTASDGATEDWFGYAVAVHNNTIVVGAYRDNIGANADQGSAYVFTRSGSIWTQQQKLTASDGAANDNFGLSVALENNTTVIGAPFDTIGANAAQGSAYVFTRSGSTWSVQRKLTADDGAANDYFGYSVAHGFYRVVVGAYGDDIGANADQGSAYLFLGGAWAFEQKVTASDGASNDQLGISVSISGSTVVLGVFNDDIGANSNQGSVYVFTEPVLWGGWIEQQKLTASDGAASDEFGAVVAINGNRLVVGAHWDTVGANAAQGSAYVFNRSGTVWSEQQKLTASDGMTDDHFGFSAGISSNTIVIGAFFDDIGVVNDQGSAWVFTVP